ncbi:tetratricopeptide repeat protein, partial [Akkermansia muciniphila]
DEGVAKMKAFIDSAPTEEWKAQASVTLACRLMNRGKADEAEGLFRSVVDAGDPTFSGFATMCLGDIARAKKDNAAAGAFYRELAEKFPSSAFALQSGGYLLRKSLFDIQSPVRIEPAVEQK